MSEAEQQTGGEAARGDAPAMQAARVVSVNIAAEKGVRKSPRAQVALVAEHGVEGDGHAGPWHRQVSLLASESIDKMRAQGLEVGPGDFGENVTTEGIVVHELPVGTRLRLGDALVEVTQIGKVCHDRCAIFYAAGDCVMPREGIFVRVLEGGPLSAGAEIVTIA
jgi:MOSC domain-containing protein YiiM